MKLPKENNQTQYCCVSEDEMEKEITIAFLKQQLKKLTPQEIANMLENIGTDERQDNRSGCSLAHCVMEQLADDLGYYLE